LAWPRPAGLETGEPNLGLASADLEICATTKVVHPTDLAVMIFSDLMLPVKWFRSESIILTLDIGQDQLCGHPYLPGIGKASSP
jgi:hypothetical protein